MAHKKIGISNPSTTQLDDGLVLLNNMIGSWSAEGLIIPYKTTENVALVVGQASYTIGSAGNFDTVRPIKIINAFIRDSNNVDYVVDVSMTREEYNDISSKNADARPGRLFYDPQYPLGYIYFDYEPTAVENIYLTS